MLMERKMGSVSTSGRMVLLMKVIGSIAKSTDLALTGGLMRESLPESGLTARSEVSAFTLGLMAAVMKVSSPKTRDKVTEST